MCMKKFATEVLNWNWKFEVSLELLIPAANPCALNVTVSMALCVYCIKKEQDRYDNSTFTELYIQASLRVQLIHAWLQNRLLQLNRSDL